MAGNDKNFLIINLSYFGDVILTAKLCGNIKKNYPDSKLFFIANTPYYEAARYIEVVDEAFCFDKRGKHRGLAGLLKFAFSFKYRNKIDYAFIIYGNERGILTSFLIGAKRRIAGYRRIVHLFLTDIHRDRDGFVHTSDINANLIKALTGKKSENTDVVYITPQESLDYIDNTLKESGYNNSELIGIAPLSKNKGKDWSAVEAAKFIQLVNQSGRKAVLTGTSGVKAFADEIREQGIHDFLDLTGKTSISQLAALIKRCSAFVSVDTGTMHLSLAVKTPTLALFFMNTTARWGPENLERNSIICNTDGISAYDCFKELLCVLEKNSLIRI
jgi:heptosyltransferase II